MRKLLILLGFVMIVYHFNSRASDELECMRDTCLVSGEVGIGFYEHPLRNGSFELVLNTTSSLEDVLTPNSKNCYRGDLKELKKIISALVGNSEYNYSQGGHLYVSYYNVVEIDDNITVLYQVSGDYPSYHTASFIKKCE